MPFQQDIRFALRSLLRAPQFSIPALTALALGIGAAAATFSVVRGVLLEPLPYRDPAGIVTLWEANVSRARTRNVVSPANFLAWGERQRVFTHLGMVGPARLSLTLAGEPQEVTGLSASAAALAALGVAPFLGATYDAAADVQGSDAVLVISYELWQRRLGARRDIIGSSLQASGRSRTVVGVMPPRFTIEGQAVDFFVPYGWTQEQLRSARGRGTSHAIARLAPGVTVERARDEMATLARQLESEAPQRNTGWTVEVVPISELTTEAVRPALSVLAGAVAVLLLIACVNVANLLLARAALRHSELGLRTALGAGRARLLRQLFTESVVLAMAAGGVALLVAFALHRLLVTAVLEQLAVPRLNEVALNGVVVAFTMGLALCTALVFGVLPAFFTTSHLNEALRERGHLAVLPRARRALQTLIVLEVALSLVLLTGAGLLVRSMQKLQRVDPGFATDGVLSARVTLPAVRYRNEREIAAFATAALERVRAGVGSERAAAISFLPLTGPGIATSFLRPDQPPPLEGQQPTTEVRPVTPDFFRTMGVPQHAGRDFTTADTFEAPLVGIISETLARRHFPGEEPLGRALRVNAGRPDGLLLTIVGVVGDIKMNSLQEETRPAVYVPHAQLPVPLLTFVARSNGDPATLTNTVVGAVRSLDAELPVADVRPLQAVVDRTLARPRAIATVMTTFALVALLLAGVGVYGVMAYSVSQRTHEIGVRMALGATAAAVFRLVLGQALLLVAAGVISGMALTALLTGGLAQTRALLFETPPLDPLTFALTALALVVVGGLAAYVPARRSVRIDATAALRGE